MRFGERSAQACPAVTAGTEADELVRVAGIRFRFVEGRFEPANVDQEILRCGFACKRICLHGKGVRLGGSLLVATLEGPDICEGCKPHAEAKRLLIGTCSKLP